MRRSTLLLAAIITAGILMAASALGSQTVRLADTYKPTADGIEFHRCPARYVALGGEKGGGKTWAACAEILSLSMEFPGNRGMLFRQKAKTLYTATLPTFFKVCPPSLIRDHLDSKKKIVLINGSEILYDGLSGNVLKSEAAVQGYLEDLKSLELGWFYINEASQTRREFFDTLKATLRWQPQGIPQGGMFYRGLVDSNPEPGWFYRTFVQGPRPKSHAFFHFKARNNPHLPPDYYDGFEGMPESWLKKYRDGLWVFDQEGDCWVYPYGLVMEAMQLEDLEGEVLPVSYGLDPAGGGADEAVLTRIREKAEQWTWAKTTGPQLRDVVLRVLDEKDDYFSLPREKRPPVNCDIHGLGGPIAEILEERGVRIGHVNLRKKPRERLRFVDRRSELFWLLREKLAAKLLPIPEDDRLREQMVGLQFDVDGTRRISVEEKKKFKTRLGHSPDRLESLVYAALGDDLSSGWKSGGI